MKIFLLLILSSVCSAGWTLNSWVGFDPNNAELVHESSNYKGQGNIFTYITFETIGGEKYIIQVRAEDPNDRWIPLHSKVYRVKRVKQPYAGDINRDGKVDNLDLYLLSSTWLKGVEVPKPEVPEPNIVEQTYVWVTFTGTKYHKTGCSYIVPQTAIKMDLVTAILTYTPCSRCKP